MFKRSASSTLPLLLPALPKFVHGPLPLVLVGPKLSISESATSYWCAPNSTNVHSAISHFVLLYSCFQNATLARLASKRSIIVPSGHQWTRGELPSRHGQFQSLEQREELAFMIPLPER